MLTEEKVNDTTYLVLQCDKCLNKAKFPGRTDEKRNERAYMAGWGVDSGTGKHLCPYHARRLT